MARKKKDYEVYIEEVRTHKMDVQATSEGGAEKEAKKLMKKGRHKAQKSEWEVIEVVEVNEEEEYEGYGEGEE